MSADARPGQGVGARVPRKEDSRHLHGRGLFVPDMILPGQLEVAAARCAAADEHGVAMLFTGMRHFRH